MTDQQATFTNDALRRIEKAVIAAIQQTEKPLSMEEAAEFLSLEVSTLASKASRGELPCHKAPKLRYYFYASELNAYIKRTLTNGKK